MKQKPLYISIYILDGQDPRGAVLESIQLLRSSLTLTEDNTVCLLDPEQFPEQFKSKLHALTKGKYFHRWDLDKTNHAENVSRAHISFDEQHSRNFNEKENDNSREDKLNECESSALRADEKEYVIHLTCVHLQLAHQRNQLLHWFYVPAMALLAGSKETLITEGSYRSAFQEIIMLMYTSICTVLKYFCFNFCREALQRLKISW